MFGSKKNYTKHAQHRMKKRGLSGSRVYSATHGTKTYLGHGKYKATSGGVTTVFARKSGKRIIITSWRSKKK